MSPFTGSPTPPPTTVLPAPPGSQWTENWKNAKKCKGNGKAFEAACEWKLCSECEEFWIKAKSEADKRDVKRGKKWLSGKQKKFCVSGTTCSTPGGAAKFLRGLKPCKYTALHQKSAEKEFIGRDYATIEQFQTQEVSTGLLVGWEGCMAEDSHSFASAFKAKVVESTNTHDRYENVMQSVPTKIFAGKLGDLTLRLGWYKLSRFNAPKGR